MSGSSFRLTVFYAVLAAVILAAFVIVFHAGSGKTAQPAIAGGYDVSAGGACLGKAFDLQQSGQYVNLGVSQQAAPKAKLRFRHGVLEGDVSCIGGGSRSFKASVRDGNLKGLAGGVPISAALKRDPPPPGAPTLIPASVGSSYNVIPRSPCLGSLLTMDQHGSAVTLTLKGPGLPPALRRGQAHGHRALRGRHESAARRQRAGSSHHHHAHAGGRRRRRGSVDARRRAQA